MCITQYGDNDRLMKKSDRNRKSKGCFDYRTKRYKLDNILYNNCIGNNAVDITYYVEAFSLYEKGILPSEGMLAEQPNKIIEIFETIHRRRQVFQDREAKDRK